MKKQPTLYIQILLKNLNNREHMPLFFHIPRQNVVNKIYGYVI